MISQGRVIGRLLVDRHVSGDLTGLARVKFDVPGQRPQRFRVVYRQVDERTREVVAIGLRDEHAIYRLAVRRIATGRYAQDGGSCVAADSNVASPS